MSGNVNPAMMNKVEWAGAAANTVSSYGAAARSRKEAKFAAYLAELRAEDIRARGEGLAAKQYGRGVRQVGAQRAAWANRGIEVGTGTPGQIEDATSLFAQLDALTIRENARREAYGEAVTAAGYRSRARSIKPLFEAAGTMIGEVGTIYRNRQERKAEGIP